MTLSPRDFAAALVGLRPPAAAAKSQSPAFSVTRQEPTQIPRGAVQTSGASSIGACLPLEFTPLLAANIAVQVFVIRFVAPGSQ
jgi:hypothetical protein